jgi:hypothetical protein
MENLAEKDSFRGGAKKKVATRDADVNGTFKKNHTGWHNETDEIDRYAVAAGQKTPRVGCAREAHGVFAGEGSGRTL